jgi:hypothetical protein
LAFSGIGLGLAKWLQLNFNQIAKFIFTGKQGCQIIKICHCRSPGLFFKEKHPCLLLWFPSLRIFKIIFKKSGRRPPFILNDGFLVS